MTAAKLPTCCQYYGKTDGCREGRECPERKLQRVMAQPITREALGVEAALPQSFTQDPPKEPRPPIDWEAVFICGAVIVTFTAVMVLSAVKA